MFIGYLDRCGFLKIMSWCFPYGRELSTKNADQEIRHWHDVMLEKVCTSIDARALTYVNMSCTVKQAIRITFELWMVKRISNDSLRWYHVKFSNWVPVVISSEKDWNDGGYNPNALFEFVRIIGHDVPNIVIVTSVLFFSGSCELY